MNELIRKASELGITGTIYDTFFALGFVSVFLFVVLYGRKMGIKTWKSIVTVLTVYPIIVLWMFVMFWIESGFTTFGGNNIVRVFVYVPVVAYPVAKLLKISWKEICSMLSLGPVAVHAVSHFGCMFPGCCMGYPYSWGLYNIKTGDIRFPSQPIEAILAWMIIIYLLVRGKKRNYVPDGREYPIMLVLFGFSRFFCEFLRDNKKLWLGCSGLAFHALFMFVVGITALLVINKKQQKTKTVSSN